MLSIENLSHTYADGKEAIRNISLSIHDGEKISILGANGAGKSTLLMHLNGVLRGTGRIVVNGLEMCKENYGKIRALVGILFQDPDDQLFSSSVYDDVAYGPIYQGLTEAEIREKVANALEAVQMAQLSDRHPFHLSGGEKKRVAIATILAMEPSILVLDEPTAGLDPRARRELIDLLGSLPQTTLVATHDLDLAARLTTRIIILNQGLLVADGEAKTSLTNEEILFANGLL